MALDELELELRRLPGVRSVGFSTGDDFLMVQVHVADETSTTPTTAFETARIARRHSTLPVSVEIVRWKSSEAQVPRRESPPVESDTREEHSGSIQAFQGSDPTIDLDFEARSEVPALDTRLRSEPAVADAVNEDVVNEDVVNEDDADTDDAFAAFDDSQRFQDEPSELAEMELQDMELDEFDDDEQAVTDVRDVPAADPSIPPRISPITTVINSFSDPLQRIMDDEPEPELEPESAAAFAAEATSDEAWHNADLPAILEATEQFNGERSSASGEGTIDLTINPAVDERVRLLAVLPFPESDEIEVHLTAGGRRSVGRAPASHGLSGAAAATLDALRGFIPEHSYAVSFAHRLPEASDQFLVVAGINEPDATMAPSQRFGVAASNSPSEAAARATLHALNRTLGIAKTRVHA